ncbi:MAG: hypothetical protein A2309_11950 [Bacteroidetes bacterium RIFOXYB2_FULL_35_7]|nr:MAG: hypothetical protein A2X01_10115 [Bacteroidetes bacterium GWF2_35_48]OFY97221.1 MAG: hypothetical protein A2309_11950 [Bacteroidetes bacterium RIFOXYB2_FULL_35_7]OFY97999.1 MAG: hypothetical protein A2491_19140 [Bacteroidetes bacterium RIFOXYC12_FULL_35_7]HBX49998.1 hypothetical protein [Bacteroidales bacterium]
MKHLSLILAIFITGFSNYSWGQCSDYILKFGNDRKGGYSRDVQSKSGLFKKGQSHKLNIVFSEGKDYEIRFYNSNPKNKVQYKMTAGGDVLFNYDNFHLQQELAVQKEEMKKQKDVLEENDGFDDEEGTMKKKMQEIAKKIAEINAAILKDNNTVPSCPFSITSTVNVEVEVTLVDTEPKTPTSCIAVLVLSKNSEGEGFQDDAFTKGKKMKEKQEEEAKAKKEADAKAKADEEAAKKAAEADKSKKKKR